MAEAPAAPVCGARSDFIGPVPFLVPWFGAVGAVLLSLHGVFAHRGLDWNTEFRFWHWSRPAIGAVVGTVCVILFQSGILAVGGDLPSESSEQTKNLLYYIIAFVVGYREDVFPSADQASRRPVESTFVSRPAASWSEAESTTSWLAAGIRLALLGNACSKTRLRLGSRLGTTSDPVPKSARIVRKRRVTYLRDGGPDSAKILVAMRVLSQSAAE